MNIKGQGHSMTLDQGHIDSSFSNFFSLETAWPIEAEIHVETPWDGRTKVCSNGPGHIWPIWPPCSYMVKTVKNLLLWNQEADDLETWFVASGARVLPSLFKWWHWIDPDLFYGNVKSGPLREEGKTMDFQKLL